MCGILGGNIDKWDYENALLAMKHRGPNGHKIIQFNEFVLGFVRLSIIDLSDNGMQPMFSFGNEICIVFNGEIYDYKELRRNLKKIGYRFKSNTDTEVIINAYLEYGDNFINYIDGMFTIAIYDFRIKKIKIYRDRAGIKPLYYYYEGKNFAFASELKSIIKLCNNINFKIDYTALYDYITYTYIPEPKTMYKKIYKLEAGHKLVFDITNCRINEISSYWKLNINTNQGKQRDKRAVEEEVKYLISKSIKEQMVADVPVGCFLSGGIDSSIVAREAFRYNANLETFSIGFTEKKFDELKYANLMANSINIKNNQQTLNKSSFNDMYHHLKNWYDEPYCDTSAFPTYLVSKLAKEKVTVVLTGDGGDEVFGGYNRYVKFLNLNIDNGFNSRKLSFLYEKFINFISSDIDIGELFLEDITKLCTLYGYEPKRRKSLFAKVWKIDSDYDDYWYFRKYYRRDLPPFTRLQYLDFNTYLPSDILTKVDRASMQVSLEARVPLLSKELIEFSFGLSEFDRCPNHLLKGLLKSAYKNLIPDEILFRPKMGFGIPDYFMDNKMSRQENVLRNIWKIKIG